MKLVLSKCPQLLADTMLLKYGSYVCCVDPGHQHLSANLIGHCRSLLVTVTDLHQ